MVRFIVSDGTEKRVSLEEVSGDVIVRVNGLGVAALRGAEGVVAVSKQACDESGLTCRFE